MAEDRLKALVRELSVLGPVAGVCRHLPVVIVDSGRGIPPMLSREVKFLPFSILSHCLLGRRIAKYRLTQVSMSLTRKGGNVVDKKKGGQNR